MKKNLLLASLAMTLSLSACFIGGDDDSSSSGSSFTKTDKVLAVDEAKKTITIQEIDSYCEDSIAINDTTTETQSWIIKDGYISLIDSGSSSCELALKTSSQSIIGTHSASAPWTFKDSQGNSCTPEENSFTSEGLTSIKAEVSPTQFKQTITLDLSGKCMADAIVEQATGQQGTTATKVDCETVKINNPAFGEIQIKSEFVGGSPFEIKQTISKDSKTCTATIITPKPGQIVDNAFCKANSGGSEKISACMMEILGLKGAEVKSTASNLARALRN